LTYQPEGVPPRVILGSDTTSQDLHRFLGDFLRFIQGGKLYEDLALPKMKVLGILGKYSDKDFFDLALQPYIMRHYPADKKHESSEGFIVDLVFQYFGSKIHKYKRLTTFRRFNWEENIHIDVFLAEEKGF